MVLKSKKVRACTEGELNQILQETFSGHMVVQAFGAEEYESRRFRDASRRLLFLRLTDTARLGETRRWGRILAKSLQISLPPGIYCRCCLK